MESGKMEMIDGTCRKREVSDSTTAATAATAAINENNRNDNYGCGVRGEVAAGNGATTTTASTVVEPPTAKRPKVEGNLAAAPAAEGNLAAAPAAEGNEDASGGGGVSSTDAASAAPVPPTAANAQHRPLTAPPKDPAELKDAIRKQVEYYFSDNNMKSDKFFQTKIKEEPEGWLHAAHILSCRNIKRLNVTSEEVLTAALEGSHLETRQNNDGAWVRRTTPLPPLEDGPGRREKTKKNGKLVDMVTFHDAGCVLKAEGCPEEVTWEIVKKSLALTLPEHVRIRFVSRLQQNGTCYVYLIKFDNDKQYFIDNPQIKFDVSGAPVTLSVVTDVEEATKVVKFILPPPVAQQRAKLLARLHGQKKGKNGAAAHANRPIMIGDTEFASVHHLRNCIKELVTKTAIGVALPKQKTAYKVISEVLKWHPNAEAKQKDMTGLKVDEVSRGDSTTKCFFVIREDDKGEETFEDFSVIKCMQRLSANPPFKGLPLPVEQGDDTTGTLTANDDNKAVTATAEDAGAAVAVVE